MFRISQNTKVKKRMTEHLIIKLGITFANFSGFVVFSFASQILVQDECLIAPI